MGWARVEGNPREIIGWKDGKAVAVVDLQVSTAADLPAEFGAVGNFLVAAGSMAQIVQSNAMVTLDGSDGNWYPAQESSESDEPEVSLSMSAGSEDRGRDTIDLEPFPEPIETEKKITEPEGGGEDER